MYFAIKIIFALKKIRVLASQMWNDRHMKHNESVHYVWSGNWVETWSALWESCREPNCGVVARYHVISDWEIIDYTIDFANEINKLLDNFVILNPFRRSSFQIKLRI